MFLTADLDFTPATQAERMFSAILRNHGHARIVTYWGEKHLTWSPANIRDRYQQIFDWLALTLDDAGSETTSADAPKGEPILQTPPPWGQPRAARARSRLPEIARPRLSPDR